MKKRVISLVLTVVLFLGLVAPVGATELDVPKIEPEVSPEVEAFVSNAFSDEMGDRVSPERCTVAEVRKVHGDEAAVQYANLVNYYYDTLDEAAFLLARDTFLYDDVTSPVLGIDGATEYLLTCSTVARANEPWVAETYPYVLGYTPISPRPARGDGLQLVTTVATPAPSTTPLSSPVPTIVPVQTTPPVPTVSPTPAPISRPQPFPDVSPDDWFYEAVNAMKNSGIITGCDDGLFHPEQTIKQGEFYAMILRAGSFRGANISGGHKPSDHWASGVMLVAHFLYFYPNLDAGWGHFFVGGGEEDFGVRKYRTEYCYPDGTVDRAEAVTRMVTLLDYVSDIDIRSMPYAGPMTYAAIPDHDEIETYITSGGWRNVGGYFTSTNGVRETIAYAYNIGVCKGVDDIGTFDPDKLLTRAEIAQLFYNAGITTRQNCLPVKQVIGAYDFNSPENVVR